MKKVSVSAPGKLMLYGEHAVVYNYPSIVTAVGSRLTAIIEANNSNEIVIDAPQVKDTRFVDAAIKVFSNQFSVVSNVKISTQSPFSGKFGFGSSSAVTVAVLAALAAFYKTEISQRELFDLSYRVVMDVQGTGSGFDVAAAAYGGTLYYQKGGVKLEPLTVDYSDISLVVGYSGVKSNTVEIVNEVARKKELYPEKFDKIMKAIAGLVDNAKEHLLSKEWDRVGKLMDFNQEFLRDLGVSTEKLESLISAAKKSGALGAKLSGAGGGDCMIAICEKSKKEAVAAAITAAGGEVLDVAWNVEGVSIEI